jgi:ATP-binding cassette subfamily B protein AbcA/BmrA
MDINVQDSPKSPGSAKTAQGDGGEESETTARSGFADLLYVVQQSYQPRRLVACAVAISLVEIASTLGSPLLTKNIVDEISGASGTAPSLGMGSPVFYLLMVLLVGGVAGGMSSYLLAKAGILVSSGLKAALAVKILRHPVSYFDERESGEYVSRISNDVGAISKLITNDLHGLIVGSILFVGSVAVLLFLDLRLTLVIFGVISAGFLVMAPSVIKLARVTRDINDSSARLSAALVRLFGDVRLVKAYTAEEHETRHTESLIADLNRANLRSSAIRSTLTPVTSLSLSIAIVSILVYGGARVSDGTLAYGTLTAFILYIFNIVGPMLQLSVFFAGLQASKGASVRLREILVAPSEGDMPPSRHPAVLGKGPGSLAFNKLAFRYGATRRAALAIDDLVLPEGESTAIVGASGAGKTSILSLIERYYEPQNGSICWGGVDIGRFPLDEWRGALGYVAQNARLLSGTIRENIEYGSTIGAGETRLRQAAAAADCIEFIEELADGFDSQVGEGGIRLSGGQRQRIAIARIFMRDPLLLLLDEPTSNLDAESEHAVLGAIRTLMIGRTTLLITHRLSALKDADNIAILEAGKVIGFGKRSDILGDAEYFGRIRECLST